MRRTCPDQRTLRRLYLGRRLSAVQVSQELGYTPEKINYWLRKFGIPKRSIAEAIYVRSNKDGDPFSIRKPHSVAEALLFGLGLGLYWGEGTKADLVSIRLGNTDPALIRTFVAFLKHFYRLPERKFRFGLQVFNGSDPAAALAFWTRALRVGKNQFQKVIITKSRGAGTYRRKSTYGVLTVYVHNRKLRDIINEEIARVAQRQSNSMVGRNAPPVGRGISRMYPE